MVVRSVSGPETVFEGGSHVMAPPIRTCIGCRSRSMAANLLRVVAVAAPLNSEVKAPEFVVVVDVRRRLPGRGAWLHATAGCVALAEKRRAYGRALRVTGTLDASAVRMHLDATDR